MEAAKQSKINTSAEFQPFTAWRSPAATLILKESPMIIMPVNRLWFLRNYQNVIYENIDVKPD